MPYSLYNWFIVHLNLSLKHWHDPGISINHFNIWFIPLFGFSLCPCIWKQLYRLNERFNKFLVINLKSYGKREALVEEQHNPGMMTNYVTFYSTLNLLIFAYLNIPYILVLEGSNSLIFSNSLILVYISSY